MVGKKKCDPTYPQEVSLVSTTRFSSSLCPTPHTLLLYLCVNTHTELPCAVNGLVDRVRFNDPSFLKPRSLTPSGEQPQKEWLLEKGQKRRKQSSAWSA